MVRSGEAPPADSAMVRRELLAACMTCPICGNLLVDATTISECLHTFCRKCIFEKLTDEDVDCCPTCKIALGCSPTEKLRPDHSLQDVRSKIFPLKRRKVNAPEAPSFPLPIRRKERSLSSLVVSTPRVTMHVYSRGRRTKATGRRKASPQPTKKGINREKDCAENSSSSETLSKITKSRRQKSSTVHPSSHAPEKNQEIGNVSFKDKSEPPCKSLDCLLEVVNGTASVKSGSRCAVPEDEARVHPHTSRMQDEKDFCTPHSQVIVKAKKLRARKKRDLQPSAQALVDAAGVTRDGRNSPIWISLLPAMDQNKETAVPQTRSCYLRIKDGNLPVSFIQKYLVKKLNLHSEAEVEIVCRSQAVSSALTLNNLAELWLRPEPSPRVQTTLGTSAQDLVMVLNYSCKAPTD